MTNYTIKNYYINLFTKMLVVSLLDKNDILGIGSIKLIYKLYYNIYSPKFAFQFI